MNQARRVRFAAPVVAVAVAAVIAAACGGSVVFTEDDGAGGSGTTGTAGTKSGTTSTKGTTAAFTMSTSMQDMCVGLPFGQCVSNAACAPIFDDACCPQCSPGACLDCVNWEFVGCGLREAVCNGDFDCGFAGEYVCQGQIPNCNGFCEGTMGCEPALCVGEGGPGGPPCPGCQGIVAGVCTAQCDEPPLPCPDGFVRASDGFCWTEMCIEEAICFVPMKD